MKLDSTTINLFSPFSTRECANPKRQPIKSQKDFEKFVERNNGVNDCYCDLYTYPFDGVIDKMYFDFDGINGGFEVALPFAQRFYEFLTERKGLDVIPVASGRKGFNLYPIFKPENYGGRAKKMLYEVQYTLIVEEFGTVVSVTVLDREGKEHPSLRNEEGLIYLDPKTIGDVRRFARIPNTLRPPENVNYCTYLPHDEFLSMTTEEVARYMKFPRSYCYPFFNSPKKALGDFPVYPDLALLIGNQNGGGAVSAGARVIPSGGSEFLKPLLRPCLYRHLLTKEPRHDVRVAATVDLLNAGIPPKTIFEAYTKLNWADWDSEVTEYQIKNVNYLKPFSCSKLRSKGIPEICCEG